jgi:3'-phosphoadenosine 5'-phosphosulfate (PAPS) 3'-phosphatase
LTAKRQNGDIRRIAVSPRQIQIPEFKSKIQKSGLKPVSVSTLTIKIVSILMGKVDAGIYFPQKGKSANVWDYAAAILLLEEFGGKMTSLDGSTMPFGGQKIIHRDGWLATNQFINHDELLSKVQ